VDGFTGAVSSEALWQEFGFSPIHSSNNPSIPHPIRRDLVSVADDPGGGGVGEDDVRKLLQRFIVMA
jgi:hypothetical protein